MRYVTSNIKITHLIIARLLRATIPKGRQKGTRPYVDKQNRDLLPLDPKRVLKRILCLYCSVQLGGLRKGYTRLHDHVGRTKSMDCRFGGLGVSTLSHLGTSSLVLCPMHISRPSAF